MRRFLSFFIATCLSVTDPEASFATGIPVFDGSNFAQSIITATQMITSVANQAQQIQNEIALIQNQVRSLRTLPTGQYDTINAGFTRQSSELDQIISGMQGMGYNNGTIMQSYNSTFPANTDWSNINAADYRGYFQKWSSEINDSSRSAMQFQGSISQMRDTNMEAERILSQVDGADGEVRQLQGVNSMLGILSTQMNGVSQNLIASGRVSAMAAAQAQAKEDAQRALLEKHYRYQRIPNDDGERF